MISQVGSGMRRVTRATRQALRVLRAVAAVICVKYDIACLTWRLYIPGHELLLAELGNNSGGGEGRVIYVY